VIFCVLLVKNQKYENGGDFPKMPEWCGLPDFGVKKPEMKRFLKGFESTSKPLR
jgi:hypothetical protein